MKKIIYSLATIAFIAFNGCQDEIIEKPFTPVQTGDEITFGSSLNNTETKTVYDEEPTPYPEGNGSYYRVSWETGDKIAIYCPQASDNNKLANYTITPNPEDGTTSLSVTKVDNALHWGSEDEHHFYGFYPASAVTGTEDGQIKGKIEVLQNPSKWEARSNNSRGTTYYGTANTDYAYMWAYGSAKKSETDQDVSLTFHPWVTILDIAIPGPSEGSPMKISNINIRAVDGTETILTGEFICNMQPVEANPEAEPTYTAVGSTSETRNTITISGWNEKANDFIELQSDKDTMMVRAYLLPVDYNTQQQTLQIRVSPVNTRVLTRTLGHTDASETQTIAAHKVNKVIMPPIANNGNNYWMSSLDPDIYVSELSIPGSWNSLLNPNYKASIIYQNTGITEQFNAGVRAFHVQTGARYTTDNYGVIHDVEFKEGDLYVAVNGQRTSTNFTSILSELTDCLNQASQEGYDQEYVFVQITYEGGAVNHYGSGGTLNTNEAWIQTINQKIPEYARDYKLIYPSEITPETTIEDLKGHIILKVNTNDETMDNSIAANAGLPSLFSRWIGAYIEDGVPLRWGSPNPDNSTQLTWFYQEAGNIHRTESYGPTDGGGNVSYAEKIEYAGNVFTKSVDLYTQNDHSYWFMNCLGGTYMPGSTENVQEFTRDISDWGQEQLQLRTENASLGLIYMNYADNLETSGQAYGTANLIQTIIDNNFKFQLRKATSN